MKTYVNLPDAERRAALARRQKFEDDRLKADIEALNKELSDYLEAEIPVLLEKLSDEPGLLDD